MSDLIGSLLGVLFFVCFHSVLYPIIVNFFYLIDPHNAWYSDNYNKLPDFLKFVKDGDKK